jgi:hypothetical protein
MRICKISASSSCCLLYSSACAIAGDPLDDLQHAFTSAPARTSMQTIWGRQPAAGSTLNKTLCNSDIPFHSSGLKLMARHDSGCGSPCAAQGPSTGLGNQSITTTAKVTLRWEQCTFLGRTFSECMCIWLHQTPTTATHLNILPGYSDQQWRLACLRPHTLKGRPISQQALQKVEVPTGQGHASGTSKVHKSESE